MNRIILIGNGFDLAHGLKTKYEQFIDWLWKKEIEKIGNYNNPDSLDHIDGDYVTVYYLTDNQIRYLKNEQNKNFKSLKALCDQNIDMHPELIFKNSFIEQISNKNNIQNWVDIEDEYYTGLKKCIDGINEIEKLNQDFEQIKNELKNYLRAVNDELKNYTMDFPIKEIMGKIYSNIEQINSILFLNFNYTMTHKFYSGEYDIDLYDRFITKNIINIKKETIQIHGSIKDVNNNPIIFGYGDEIGKEYLEIENLNDNRFLENIKSIKYLETRNYKKLLDLIKSDYYQIFIMGHSCGLSDRTLLNTLFEHENCVQIKLFYHKKENDTDNYSDVIRNISRNFANKAIMREKIVNKMDSVPLK